jgi:hypothetical protein
MTTTISKRLRGNARVRSVAIPAYQIAARRRSSDPAPRVMANSLPKSGTHLLQRLLQQLPKMRFSGVHHALNEFRPDREERAVPDRAVDWDRVRHALEPVREGQFATAHFEWLPELQTILDDLDYRRLLILRDPRDVAVSTVLYVSRLQRHWLHDRLTSEFDTFGDQLEAIITGLPAANGHGGSESIASAVAHFVPWLDDPLTHTLRYEDLVGEAGGGNRERQLSAVAAAADHVDRPLTDTEIASIADRLYSRRSPTFRKGVIGDWREHFEPRHTEAFKAIAGDALVRLGYEADDSW